MALNVSNLSVSSDGRVSFSGLSSGIDFKAAIDGIIAAKRIPVDTLENRVTANEEKVTAFKDLQALLTSLKESLATLRGAVSLGSANDIFTAKQAFATTSRTDGVTPSAAANLIGVSVTNAASLDSHSIEVRRVAAAHKVSSASFNSLSDDAGTALGLGANTVSGSFDVAGTTISVSSTDSIQEIRDRINNANTGATPTKVSASIVSVSTTEHYLVLTNDDTGAAMTIDNEVGGVLGQLGISSDGGTTFSNQLQAAESARFTADGILDPDRYESNAQTSAGASIATAGGTFDIVGTGTSTITYVAGETLTSLAAKINAANATTGVTATVATDSTGARLELTHDSSTAFTLTDTSGLLGTLGVDNNLVVTRTKNTIDDLFTGVTISLFQAEIGTTIKFDVDRDLTSVKTALESFVAAYNTVKEFINTQSQVDATSGKADAEAGVLFGSRALVDVESQLSLLLGQNTEGVNTAYTVLAQVGINFVDNNSLNDPLLADTLEITEATLDAKLLSNIDDVRRLFTFDFSTTDPNVVLLSYSGQTSYDKGGYRLNIEHQASTELVTNGTFTTGATGWTAVDGAILTSVGGKLHIENGAALDGIARQTVTVEVGETYSIAALRTITGGAVGKIEVRDAGNVLLSSFINEASTSGSFTATTSTVSINFSPNSSALGQNVEFDDISIKKTSNTSITTANITADADRITNGTFTTDTSGWSAVNSAILTTVGGKLHIVNGAAIDGIARQTVNLDIGATYRIRGNRTQSGAAVGKIEVRDATNALLGSYINEASTDATFVATTATATINLSPNSSGAGADVEFDNLILERIDTTDTSTVTVSGTTLTITDQSGAEGLKLFYAGTTTANVDVNFTVGLGAQMFFALDGMLDPTTGVIQNEIDSLEGQNAVANERISEMTLRLDIRRETLTQQFLKLEVILASAETMRNSITQTFDALTASRS